MQNSGRRRGSVAIEALLSVAVTLILVLTLFGGVLSLYSDDVLEWSVLGVRDELSLLSMPLMGHEAILERIGKGIILEYAATCALENALSARSDGLLIRSPAVYTQFDDFGFVELDVRYGYTIPGFKRSGRLVLPASAAVVSDGELFSKKSVYITTYGERYHLSGCRHLRKSRFAIDLKEAKAKGYTPCKHCYGKRQEGVEKD